MSLEELAKELATVKWESKKKRKTLRFDFVIRKGSSDTPRQILG